MSEACVLSLFFFNDTATTEIYTLSLHDALPSYAPGATIPRHRHSGDEQIFVLEGAVSDDTGTCTRGNYARRPPGCVHRVWSREGALVLAIMTGGTESA